MHPMSEKYCLPVPVFHFWPKLTHPAARSLCFGWATCFHCTEYRSKICHFLLDLEGSNMSARQWELTFTKFELGLLTRSWLLTFYCRVLTRYAMLWVWLWAAEFSKCVIWFCCVIKFCTKFHQSPTIRGVTAGVDFCKFVSLISQRWEKGPTSHMWKSEDHCWRSQNLI